MRDAQGHEHEPAGTPIGGQFAFTGGKGTQSAFSSEEKAALKDYIDTHEKVNEQLALEDLMAKAPGNQLELEAAGREISTATGGKFVTPGVKTRASTERKLSTGRKVGSLTDVVRAGFMVDSPEQADAIVGELGKRFPIHDEGWAVTPVGYFDRKVIVTFNNGVRGEIQIWQPDMFKTKEFGGGHKLYEAARVLPNGTPQKADLLFQMKELYTGVIMTLPTAWSAVAGPIS